MKLELLTIISLLLACCGRGTALRALSVLPSPEQTPLVQQLAALSLPLALSSQGCIEGLCCSRVWVLCDLGNGLASGVSSSRDGSSVCMGKAPFTGLFLKLAWLLPHFLPKGYPFPLCTRGSYPHSLQRPGKGPISSYSSEADPKAH